MAVLWQLTSFYHEIILVLESEKEEAIPERK